ncbi:MAG: rhodanese-like domain-containing protein [Desulfacinum sp.]|jgi:rhodanese-related sulfurtransferase|nr:rhodanese-like domain-containing protein [Desulfacinum sp.]
MKRTVLVLAGLVALGWLAAPVRDAYAWGKKELETEKVAVTFHREVERGGYQVVTTEELKQWMDQGREMLIVDTMPYEASYKKQHIPGAVQMEFPIPEMESLDPAQRDALTELLGPEKDRLIVFYCGFTKCTRSHNGAMWAVKLGYTNVYRCPGGIKGWMEAGYPAEKVQ